MSKALQSVLSKLSALREFASQPRGRRLGKQVLASVAVLLVSGFFLVPPVLEPVLEKQLAKALHGEVRIDDLAINPLVLSVTVKGLAVVRDGKEQAAFDELYINLSAASLFKMAAVVDEIKLAGLRVSVARTGDGQYDISDLLDEWLKPDETPDKTPPRFSLNNIQLVDARIEFADLPRAREFVVSDLDLSLPFLSSLPYQAEILVQPMLSANVNGSFFRLDGQTTPFADGRESELRFDLAGFDLAQLQPYLPAGLPVKIATARLDSQIRAVFRELPGGVNSLVFVGNARLADLQLQQGDGQALLAWKGLAVELSQIDPFNRQFVVQRLALDGLELDLSVNRLGELNLLALAGGSSAAPAADAPAAPVHWSLGEFALNDATLRWRDSSGSKPVNGEIRQFSARLGPLDEKLASVEVIEAAAQVDFGEQLQLPSLAVKALRVDLAGQRIEIGEVSNAGTRIVLRRNADGEIEWLTPPRLKAAAGSAQKPASAPWLARVATLAVDDLGLRFEDRSVQPVAVQQIDGLSLSGEGLGNLANEKGRLSLQATVNKQGKLAVDGDLQAEPFASNLKIDGQAIPLASLQGYSGQFLNVLLQRGQFSAKGDASLRQEKGRLLAGYKGSATLGNLLLVDPENKADFLKWKSLHLGGIDFRLDPMRIDIREIALSDFYSRLILNEAGRLNLAGIVRQPAAPAAEAETTTVAPTEKAPLPLSIARVTLNNGMVNFSDRFVRPNYTVDIGKLGGRVTGLSSVDGTLAELELRGSYGRAAPVLISARLNPLAAKSFLDLKAEVKDVDLTGFSPYSGKYAGYLIDKGKLSLNLAYKLENQQLTATNGLFLDQLTLGERVDSPDATSLPVNLAIALLRNNRGEIDINLPISGSLDDPQFSLGGVIVKVIVNLFVKAVTSPFALLGSMFGDGEELSTLAFAPGQTQIDAAAGKKLEALARALNERSALKLDITGHADPETDREGLKRFAIEQAMQREKLADLRKQGKDVETTSIEPAEYPAYLARVYKAAKFPKPRNFIGLQKDLPVEEMEKLLLTHLPASDDDLRQLARVRAEQVQAWLLEQGKVAPEQLFLVPPKAGKASGGGRVEFSLR
ncbi:DUF748 domain-containing protein [Azonexus hydrophilus]|uniref:DUF748 domain-containing protein n=1 Tax=Azonexus hydrophilus TaxID=418702 RepID=UPI000406B401|nr:DUF748 domain-containing protein [Azonexus hydrophilus]